MKLIEHRKVIGRFREGHIRMMEGKVIGRFREGHIRMMEVH